MQKFLHHTIRRLERFLEDLQFHLCFAGSDTNASDGWYYPEGKNQEMEITLRAETLSNEVVINGSVDFITSAQFKVDGN